MRVLVEQADILMSAPPAAGAAGRLHLVVAFDQVGGIGKDGTIPWTLPPDLKRFKELTTALQQGAVPGSFNIVIMVTSPAATLHWCAFAQRFPPTCSDSHSSECSFRAGRRGILSQPSSSPWLAASTSSYPPTPSWHFHPAPYSLQILNLQ